MKKNILLATVIVLFAFGIIGCSDDTKPPEKPVAAHEDDSPKPCPFISDVDMLDNKHWPGEFVECVVETQTYKINADTAGVTPLKFHAYRTRTVTQNLCSYKTYHAYNLRHNEEIRVYNSALVIRCQ